MGVSAAGLIQKLTPDLIFLDLQMPQMMGLDVIQAVRSTTATIVVVTARKDGALSALDAGAAGSRRSAEQSPECDLFAPPTVCVR
jgi:CheY-like chemotaxis protein